MSFQIEMPQLSAEGASDGEGAVLASWLVEPGERVEKGQVIAEIETDKSTVELEAPVSGTIGELLVAGGTEGITPGTLLGSIEADDSAATGEGVASSEPPNASRDESPAPTPAPPPTPNADPDRGRAATPLARRAAAEQGVDLAAVEGTGPGGRIVQADVLRSEADPAAGANADRRNGADHDADAGLRSVRLDSRPAPATGDAASGADLEEGVEVVRLSAMRKTIARRLTESKQQVPHFYLRVRCAMDAVLALRKDLNAGLADDGYETRLSVNDFVLRAAALALRAVPAANVRFMGDTMHVLDRVDVSVAVAIEGGLVTPVVRDADRKGLRALSDEVRSLATRAREGGLKPEEYRGGSLTISNLGMYGIETVYPILNPPEACILGVGAAEAQPVVRDGAIAVGHVAAITLAADHRAVDGAVGAQLLAALRERLEDPLSMML